MNDTGVFLRAFRDAAARGTMAAPLGDRTTDTSAISLAVSGLLGREIAIDDLLASLVEQIRAALDADRGTLYLVDRAKGELFSRAAHLPELDEIRLSLGQGLAGHVAETGEVVNVPEARGEPRFFGGVDEKTGYQTTTSLTAPVPDRAGDTIGVVQLLNKRGGPFTEVDEARLAILATQAALAIEATSIYQDLCRAPDEAHTPVPILDQFNGIVGDSEALRAACRRTTKAAPTDATVLIRGESGTGKELFARAIHVNSRRATAPFVKVDCAALPATLIDNELFGHEKGAYTSAEDRAVGKLDVASTGTLFLDEIGELPIEVQGKLLRVLQDREFQRVGGTATMKADVRIVAATNRDLESMIEAGRFRADLYYRLKVVQLDLPPLRERIGDIDRLTKHFIVTAARRHGRVVPTVSSAASAKLRGYRWPGNVRELENCLESAVIVMDGTELLAEHLPLPDDPTTPIGAPMTLAEVEKRHILAVLEQAGGQRAAASKILGIGRNTLTRKLASWGVD